MVVFVIYNYGDINKLVVEEIVFPSLEKEQGKAWPLFVCLIYFFFVVWGLKGLMEVGVRHIFPSLAPRVGGRHVGAWHGQNRSRHAQV